MFAFLWSSKPKASNPETPRARFSLDQFEDRLTPASVKISNHVLEIVGSKYDDVVIVSVNNSDQIVVKHDGKTEKFKAANVDSIRFEGKDGNDRFENRTSVPSKAYGDSGNDTLIGGDGKDKLYGGEGNDKLDGGRGNDSLYGEAGNDAIIGSGGDDFLSGGGGNDTIKGGGGNDMLNGDSGKDMLRGGSGDDRMNGGRGTDKLYGEEGSDELDAGKDSVEDQLYGGSGHDTFHVYGTTNAMGHFSTRDTADWNSPEQMMKWPE